MVLVSVSRLVSWPGSCSVLVNVPRGLEMHVWKLFGGLLYRYRLGQIGCSAFCITVSPLWPRSQDSPPLLGNPWPFPWAWGQWLWLATEEGGGEIQAMLWSKFVPETRCQVISDPGKRVKCSRGGQVSRRPGVRAGGQAFTCSAFQVAASRQGPAWARCSLTTPPCGNHRRAGLSQIWVRVLALPQGAVRSWGVIHVPDPRLPHLLSGRVISALQVLRRAEKDSCPA